MNFTVQAMDSFRYHLQKVKNLVGHYYNVLGEAGSVAPFTKNELQDILAHWDIEKIDSIKVLSGGASSNWIVKTLTGQYVLRNASSNRAYIDFQILVTHELVKQGFPYTIPQFLPTSDSYYVKFQDDFWLLYEFVVGSPLKRISSVDQAWSMGQLVARFHQVVCKIDHSSLQNFALALFEVDRVASAFQERVALIGTRTKRHTSADKLFLAHVDLFLEAATKISLSDKAAVKSLKSMPIYDDWHGYNVVGTKGKIVGLIDFDSLVTAPRIVDIQNALLYVAGTKHGVDICRLYAFIQGYTAVLPLSELKLSLVYSLMIDRVTAIISDILLAKKTIGPRHKDNVLFFLITQLSSIIKNKETLDKNLIAAAETKH